MVKTTQEDEFIFISVPFRKEEKVFTVKNIPEKLRIKSKEDIMNLDTCQKALINRNPETSKQIENNCEIKEQKESYIEKVHLNGYTIISITKKGNLEVMCTAHAQVESKGILIIIIDNNCHAQFEREEITLGNTKDSAIRMAVLINERMNDGNIGMTNIITIPVGVVLSLIVMIGILCGIKKWKNAK